MRKAPRGWKYAWLEARRAATLVLVNAALKCQPFTPEDEETFFAFLKLQKAIYSDACRQADARKREREQKMDTEKAMDYVATVATATSQIVCEYMRMLGPFAGAQFNEDRLAHLTARIRDVLTAGAKPEGDDLAESTPSIVPDLRPPVPIDETVFRDYIISLEDGKPYKGLKRHLGARNMTPDDYRKKWGLPADYPMTAPGYSERRSELAKEMGLGTHKLSRAIQNF